ncbi:MAG TPA: hypothetical protein VFJ72_02025 [Rubrobacteraceae bacterium]|nr:hypothetical protein [Rubrobacteraceae bacterium]
MTILLLVMGLMLALGAGVALAGVGSVFVGTSQNDRLLGTRGDDNINALQGDDFVNARGGDDVVDGGANHDRLQGWTGNDRLIGGTGQDVLLGGFGNDIIDARDNGGQDDINCGPGRDTLLADAADRDIALTSCERVLR